MMYAWFYNRSTNIWYQVGLPKLHIERALLRQSGLIHVKVCGWGMNVRFQEITARAFLDSITDGQLVLLDRNEVPHKIRALATR